ncbi:unnamed protein product [Lactuca virosa]|uniref:Uncharacterized protein n=1 Tax=Lactuca virosa TaxID=75947 RepID=A0AAU9LWW3_9ASTR|nr:unnamed protein product [Lactuca virosa]
MWEPPRVSGGSWVLFLEASLPLELPSSELLVVGFYHHSPSLLSSELGKKRYFRFEREGPNLPAQHPQSFPH